MSPPYVVILGAGASRAACGDDFPCMDNILRKLELEDEFPSLRGVDFEQGYARIAGDPHRSDERDRLERRVRDWFSNRSLKHDPTLYDHLVMAMRPNDVIATFNWDPFLVHAVRRCYRVGVEPPQLVFLHGNVAVGHCLTEDHKTMGPIERLCPDCGKPFKPSTLLYPVSNKNYSYDPLIAEAWRFLERALQHAYMVTIFGYSAPSSDVDAVSRIKRAWGRRKYEQVEIIDIRDRGEIREVWGELFFSHHWRVHRCFYDSYIARFPRRMHDAFCEQYIHGRWIQETPIPKRLPWDDLFDWFDALCDAESAGEPEGARGSLR